MCSGEQGHDLGCLAHKRDTAKRARQQCPHVCWLRDWTPLPPAVRGAGDYSDEASHNGVSGSWGKGCTSTPDSEQATDVVPALRG